MNNYYNAKLLEHSRELRNHGVSRAERFLWKALLSRKQTGFGFKRQRSLHYFIVDFFCGELQLIVEIDGSSHLQKAEYDAWRQREIEALGYTILRFSEGEVMQNYAYVEMQILHAIHVLDEEKRNG